jgi:ABC-type nitrate/sulfonate/bicarbonate transport system substrate-binding protein
MTALLRVLAVIIVCIWTELAGAASAGPRVVVAHGAMNARVAPLWAARDRGFFAKYGVTADTIVVRGSAILLAAMATNEIDVGYTGVRPSSEPLPVGPILRSFQRLPTASTTI